MHESDTYLMILEEGMAMGRRESIRLVGEALLGAPDESVKAQLNRITDLEHLKRMLQRAAKAASWQEILDTP